MTSRLVVNNIDNDTGVTTIRLNPTYASFELNSAERVRIKSDGKVGIGTDNPVAKLDVYVDNTDLSGIIQVTQDGIGDAAIDFQLKGTREYSLGIDNSDSDKFKLSGSAGLDNNTLITVTNSGDIGIGTDNPTGAAALTGNTAVLAVGIVTTNNLYVTDSFVVNPIEVSGISTFKDDVHFHGSTGITTLTWDKSANSLKFNDGVQAEFGDSQDLSIYHNGSHSIIEESGTGNLKLIANVVDVRNAGDSGYIARFKQSDAVELYFSNAKKFETSNGGTYTTGISTVSGVINSLTDVQINGVSVTTSAIDDAVAMAIALG